MIDENAIRTRYAAIKDRLDERGRRLFVAAEKAAAGYGGTAAVCRATGVARSTIIRGAKDLLAASPSTARVRRKGAGRPLAGKADPTGLEDLGRLGGPGWGAAQACRPAACEQGGPDGARGSAPLGGAGDDGRPDAVGVEEPREAGGG